MKCLSSVRKELAHADFWILLAASCFLLSFIAVETRNHLSDSGTYLTVLYRILLALVTCTLFYLGGMLRAQRTGSRRALRLVLILCFLVYLYLILTFTLIDKTLGRGDGSRYGEGEEMRAYYLKWFVNLVPFRSIYEVYIQGFFKGYFSESHLLLNLLGNLCAFMPFSVFLPLFWKKMQKWYFFIPTILLTVCTVEVLQFVFMVGSCDVDDLILNAGGAILLYLILKIPPLQRAFKRLMLA